jgi:hypothetical protein
VTAQRWWVRWFARQLARIDGVAGQLRLAFLMLTGVSTALVALRSYGYGQYAWPMIAGLGIATVVYTYAYTEGGVWNQQRRDKADMATNWAGPNMLIQARMMARALRAAEKGEPLDEQEVNALTEESERMWQDMRDGVDIDE